MSQESQFMAGFLLITMPSVALGGVSILTLTLRGSDYMKNPLRKNLWRAGHAHAGVLLILSLVALLYVDQTNLSETWKWAVRLAIPSAAIFMPAAFFLSVLSPEIERPNALINLAYIGAVTLVFGLFVLGVGLIT
jgi:hypothetical protein